MTTYNVDVRKVGIDSSDRKPATEAEKVRSYDATAPKAHLKAPTVGWEFDKQQKRK